MSIVFLLIGSIFSLLGIISVMIYYGLNDKHAMLVSLTHIIYIILSLIWYRDIKNWVKYKDFIYNRSNHIDRDQ